MSRLLTIAPLLEYCLNIALHHTSIHCADDIATGSPGRMSINSGSRRGDDHVGELSAEATGGAAGLREQESSYTQMISQ